MKKMRDLMQDIHAMEIINKGKHFYDDERHMLGILRMKAYDDKIEHIDIIGFEGAEYLIINDIRYSLHSENNMQPVLGRRWFEIFDEICEEHLQILIQNCGYKDFDTFKVAIERELTKWYYRADKNTRLKVTSMAENYENCNNVTHALNKIVMLQELKKGAARAV